jgi:sigma-B regulation protein RsbU (phosphoserine phosphatase)
MCNLNRLVYESSAPNRYATFFYGEYDAATSQLVYVNAGHNPPIVVRCSGEIARLDIGGPVIGLLPEVVYQEGSIELGPGETLVAFTDGVSESMNAEYEEWGEERLVGALHARRSQVPGDLIACLMAGADAFAAGAPQHDDMTIVVVQRQP